MEEGQSETPATHSTNIRKHPLPSAPALCACRCSWQRGRRCTSSRRAATRRSSARRGAATPRACRRFSSALPPGHGGQKKGVQYICYRKAIFSEHRGPVRPSGDSLLLRVYSTFTTQNFHFPSSGARSDRNSKYEFTVYLL